MFVWLENPVWRLLNGVFVWEYLVYLGSYFIIDQFRHKAKIVK